MGISIDYKQKGWLQSSGNERTFRPGVSGSIKKPIPLDDGELEVGRAIIQPTDHPNRYLITPFVAIESSDSTLPESERNIRTLDTHEVFLDKPRDYLNFNDERYARSQHALFTPEGFDIEVIQQGRVPDCFFLVAIAAILNHPNGDGYIRSLMRQNDDGTTTVKLFHPHTAEPIYIKVENSYIIDDDGALSNHRELWPMLLEKAYLGLAEELEKSDISMRSVYSGGGQRRIALAVLTGQPVAEKLLDFDINTLAFDVATSFAYELEAIKTLIPLRAIKPNFDEVVDGILLAGQELFKLIYQDDAIALEKCRELMFFYIDNKELWDAHIHTSPGTQAELESLIDALKDTAQAIAETLEDLHSYYFDPIALNRQRIATPAFDGVYTPEEIVVYDDMVKALTNGQLITAGTKKKNDYSDEQMEQLNGLRTTHAYSVLDVFEKKVSIAAEGTTKTMHFVRMRNPWGNTGKVYLPDVDSGEYIATEQRQAGTFDLPLEDFCRLFASYSVTDSVNPLFNTAAKKEQLADAILTTLEQWPQLGNHHHINIVEALDSYQRVERLMIDTELYQLEAIDAELLDYIFSIFANDEYEDALKQLSIKGLIDTKTFPYVSGDEDTVKDYVFKLLKAKWQQSINGVNTDVEPGVKNFILAKQSDSGLWQKLNGNYQTLRIIAFENIKLCLPEIIQSTADLIDKLDITLESMPEDEGPMQKLYLQTFAVNYQLMSLNLRVLYEYQVMLQRFNIDIYQGEFENITTLREAVKTKRNHHPLSDEIQSQINEVTNAIDELKPQNLSLENQAVIQSKLDALALEAVRYVPNNPQQLEQQENLSGILASIKSLFESIIITINAWFAPQKNAYEINADGDLPFNNPASSDFGFFTSAKETVVADLKGAEPSFLTT